MITEIETRFRPPETLDDETLVPGVVHVTRGHEMHSFVRTNRRPCARSLDCWLRV
jgi:hypothetical protein